jgi:Ecdysteroid kinase-like family
MSTGPLQIVSKAEHLTDALRRSGTLGNGRVCNVVVESSRSTLLSKIIRLRLTYEGAASHAPNSIILKTGLTEGIGGWWNTGRQEVAFYTQVAAVMSTRLVPRCFEAVWDTDTKAWHLLLEDLTDSHVIATTRPLPPTMEQCESIVHARARLHAEWWDDPRLGASIGCGTV